MAELKGKKKTVVSQFEVGSASCPDWSVVNWYCTRNVECLAHAQKGLISLAFDGYEAVRLWWQDGGRRVVSFEKIAIIVRFRSSFR
jgi:hypothetical protein